MRILLTTLNSKYIHSNLALKYLYMAGVKYCPGLEITEFTINNSDDYIYTELMRHEYDVICFSCYVWNIEKTKYLCENLKKARPELKIILGGPEVSFECESFLEENPYIDALMFGEGEVTFRLLACALEYGVPKFPDIRGLAYRAGDRVFVNEPMEPVTFDQLPFPYEGLPLDDDKVIYYESSRGCPYGCTYCMSSVDSCLRVLPIERVKEELKYFIYKDVKQVKFIDRTFNWSESRAVEIMEYLMEMDNGITNFHFELCGSLVGEKFLETADRARPDLFQFEIGVQSTNPLTQQAVNRNEDSGKALENIRKLYEMGGAHIHVDLIAGLPYEDMKSFRKSFDDLYKVGADAIQVGFLKLLKGTPIRSEEDMYGYEFRKLAPYEFISNRFMSSRDVIVIKQLETVLDLFYNRGGFEITLEKCIADDISPFDFYVELSDYYYLKGYQHRNHSKDDLYRIMHGFLSWKARYYKIDMEEELGCLERDLRYRMDESRVEKFLKKGWKFPEE